MGLRARVELPYKLVMTSEFLQNYFSSLREVS